MSEQKVEIYQSTNGQAERCVQFEDDTVRLNRQPHQLPPLDIRIGQKRTTTVLFAYKQFSDMDKSDKVRACLQHCVLRYLMG